LQKETTEEQGRSVKGSNPVLQRTWGIIMMPDTKTQKEIEKKIELKEDMQKLKDLMLLAVIISFGAGFIAGAELI
jgi:hypothetical protein